MGGGQFFAVLSTEKGGSVCAVLIVHIALATPLTCPGTLVWCVGGGGGGVSQDWALLATPLEHPVTLLWLSSLWWGGGGDTFDPDVGQLGCPHCAGQAAGTPCCCIVSASDRVGGGGGV